MLVVKKSRIGLGAFLTQAVSQGGVIVDWSGHPLFINPPRIPSDWKFIEIEPGVFTGPIDPEGNPDAYINHSCIPNAEIRVDRPRVHLVALTDLALGQEVTFDYATLYRWPWSMECRCGVPSCRRIVRGYVTALLGNH